MTLNLYKLIQLFLAFLLFKMTSNSIINLTRNFKFKTSDKQNKSYLENRFLSTDHVTNTDNQPNQPNLFESNPKIDRDLILLKPNIPYIVPGGIDIVYDEEVSKEREILIPPGITLVKDDNLGISTISFRNTSHTKFNTYQTKNYDTNQLQKVFEKLLTGIYIILEKSYDDFVNST